MKKQQKHVIMLELTPKQVKTINEIIMIKITTNETTQSIISKMINHFVAIRDELTTH